MADSQNARRKEPEAEAAEPADWLPAVANAFRLLREINGREKREGDELREEREFAVWVAATCAERYTRFNLPSPMLEEEAELDTAVRYRRDNDFSVLRPEDQEEIKCHIGNDGILRHFD